MQDSSDWLDEEIISPSGLKEIERARAEGKSDHIHDVFNEYHPFRDPPSRLLMLITLNVALLVIIAGLIYNDLHG